MKKVLVIAYFFPPIGGSGVQRTLKFVKYLPKFDVLPVVSTVRSGHNFAYDESLLGEIPETVKVYRSNSLETLWLRDIVEKFSRRKPPAQVQAAKPEVVAAQNNAVRTTKSLKQRLFEVIDNYLFIPDSKVRWLPFGFLGSLKAARAEQVDCLYSSSYPYTVHLIALLVKKFYHKPWIVDFRDPWVGNKAMAKPIWFREKLDIWLERKVVKNADRVINVTPDLTDMYKQRYPEYAGKFITITNGFDPADFKQVKPHSFEKYTLIHTGILTKRRSPESLVRGLELLVKRRPELRDSIRVLFVGSIPDEFAKLFQQSPLADMFEIRDYVPHHVCLDYLAGSDLLLLIFDDSPETKAAYSGKIFDYIGIEKPILGILPDGVAADLIREKGIGTVVALGEADPVANAIEIYYDQWAAGNGKLDSAERCAEFSRVSLTRRLAEVIRQLK